MLTSLKKVWRKKNIWPFMLIVGMFIVSQGILQMTRINHDVSWLLYMASENLDGRQIYHDLVEVNPPLIIWLITPSIWISGSFNISLAAGFNLYVLLLASGSLLLCWTYLHRLQVKNWPWLLVIMAYVFTIVPASHFGQREHLTVILTLPYLLLIMARKKEVSVPGILIVIPAIAAGAGFCIKPHFLIIPAILELYLFASIGIRKTIKRIEPYIIGACAGGYVLAVFVFTPDYFSMIIPYSLEVYDAAHQKPLIDTMRMVMSPLFLIFLGIYWTKMRNYTIKETVFPVFLIAALGMMIVALVQAKGWWSHLLPAQSFAIIGVSALLVMFWRRAEEKSVIRSIQTLLIVGMITATLIPVYESLHNPNAENSKKLQQRIENVPEIKSFWVMSASLSHGFPVVTETSLKWGSRFGSLWLVPGVHQRRSDIGGTTPLLDQIENYYWQAVAQDLQRLDPDLVFVDVRKEKHYFSKNGFNFVEDFSQNSNFKDVWSNYQKVGEFEDFFEIYQRQSNP